MLSDEDVLAAIESAGRDPAAGAEALIAAANARGGEDNITAVLFELVEGEATPEEPPGATVEPTAMPDPTPERAAADSEVARHGAGPGGRAAALALIAAVVVVGALVLYWGITK
jgi:hypothetical protein